ncbi:flagellar export protein FliJ [Alicyclobacillus macrosporangiidus]|jgi:flagellar export protein FliJ|uniref:Flagellar export protein FliJ n=1 Tax=Alicyclobacillus macrosporangiidus TaxID=392015 RepID=A0A1I7IQG9_9BACL|nr:flagellar FliJ family protein [Alicyclobacillus macrosporangiidus]SFU75162.1 flagellar export protein FliJ [Alicyclobacillus macrosporangiidus]
MNDRRRRYGRLLKLKQGMERVAGMALVRAERARDAASDEVAAVQDAVAQAYRWRDGCRTGADLHLWHEYVQALTQRARHGTAKLAEAEAQVERDRQRVREAHREVKRWELALESEIQLDRALRLRGLQRELDDHVARSWRRGG